MPRVHISPRIKVWLTGICYSIAIAGSVIGVILLLGVLNKIDSQTRRIEAQGKQISRQSAQIEAQGKQAYLDLQQATQIIEDDMECIGTFFSLPDRDSLRIVNLRDCIIINEATGEERQLPLTFVQPQATGETPGSEPSPSTPPPGPQSPQSQNPPAQSQPPAQTPDNRGGVQKALDAVGGFLEDAVNFINPF